MNVTKQITILGGGIIGLACAYYLHRDGHQVQVIDKNKIGDSCALGNAGYITPSHIIPLAAPGMIKKGLKWMLNPESPFYIHPRLDASLLSWMWKFNQHCTHQHVNNVKQTLFSLCNQSKSLYLELAKDLEQSFHLKENGIYVLCQSSKILAEELDLLEQARALGINVSEVSSNQMRQKYPDMDFHIQGGIYFPDDAHVHPGDLLTALYTDLKSKGVEFVEQCEVTKLECQHSKVKRLLSEDRVFEVDELVIATGSWSAQLSQQLKLSIPIEAGKGYSVTIDKPWAIDTPIILADSAVAITPFENQIRFGGTMELAGLDLSINPRRVDGILNSVKRFIKNFEIEKVDRNSAWAGLRPCTPDGLPLVGRVPGLENTALAAGHAMLGLTMAPVTGQLISRLIANQKDPMFKQLAVDRFA